MKFVSRVLCLLILTMPWIPPKSAYAHSWYDRSCCHDEDCAPIIKPLEYLGNGDILATTKVGTTIVPKSAQRLISQDDQVHVCMSINQVVGSHHDGTPLHAFYCIYETGGF